MKKLVEIARFTDRLDEMAAFYEKLLGAPAAARSEGMAIFMLGDVKLFLHASYTPKDGELPPEDHIAYQVPEVDAACAALADEGLVVEIPPQDYYWGTSAYLRDPDGHLIELIEG